MTLCYLIAIGGNLPFRGLATRDVVQSVVEFVSERIGRIGAMSRHFQTPAFPAGHGPDYVNAALSVETLLSPQEVLRILHEIEAEFGRERDSRWGRRTLDLDLIACGNKVLPDVAQWRHWADLDLKDQMRLAPDQLILPHPRMQDRAFVLAPLMDVAPDWVHPVLGRNVAQLFAELSEKDRAEAVPLPESGCQ